MAEFDLKTIGIFDEENYTDIIKKIIEDTEDDEPIFLLDIEDIVRKHKSWLTKMPRVVPHYAVKCNPDPTLIRILAALNANFDCASKPEIQLVMQAGVTCDRIIYAHPGKAVSHIRYAKKVGVERTTVDSKDEILKIKEAYPDAKLLIRLALDGKNCGVKFSQKFGCEPTTEVVELMEYMKEIKMTLVGFSFHLGSPCWETSSYARGIKICSDLINTAKTMGHSEAKVIDIGGGMVAKDVDYFDRLAASVNGALNDIDPSIEVISEPGRYYVETAFTLSACIIGKKIVKTDGDLKRFYYVNESTYGSFIEELLNLMQRIPISLYHSNEKYPSRIWGRTADPYDVIIKNEMMQEFELNDWMIWTDMGAYSLTLASRFNGFIPATVRPFIRKSAVEYVLAEINNSLKR